MHDPRTFWLVLTNVALGAALVVLIGIAAGGILCEFISRLRKRNHWRKQIDRDIQRWFHHSNHP